MSIVRFGSPLVLFVSSVLFFNPVAGQGGGAAAVSGTATVNKTTIALKHGRADCMSPRRATQGLTRRAKYQATVVEFAIWLGDARVDS